MGVPFFFRYIRDKFPSAVIQYKPDRDYHHFDNLYIDCNGLVHSVVYEKGGSKIQRFIDMIEDLIIQFNPKLLFLSFDGIAPYAKMKHQRKRRFKSAWKKSVKAKLRKGYKTLLFQNGVQPPHMTLEKEEEKEFDGNAISPGTAFLCELCEKVSSHFLGTLHKRGYDCIVSDTSVFGEGEQKIVHYIRSEQAKPNYDPRITHCVCGMDADFIFLGLGLHNANVYISRGVYHGSDSLVFMGNLRKCIALEFTDPNLSFTLDIERVIDDFCCLFLFLGNDFLPSVPFLDLLRNDHIDLVLDAYKETLWYWSDNYSKVKPYLLNREKMQFANIGVFMSFLEKIEARSIKEVEESLIKDGDGDAIFNPPKKLTVDELIEKAVADFDSSRDVMLKGLPKGVSRGDIWLYMQQNFGTVVDVRTPGVIVFVRFAHESSVTKAVAMDNHLQPEGAKKPIRIYRCGFTDGKTILARVAPPEGRSLEDLGIEGDVKKYVLAKVNNEKFHYGAVKFIHTRSDHFLIGMNNPMNANKMDGQSTVILGQLVTFEKAKEMGSDDFDHRYEKLVKKFEELHINNTSPTKYARWLIEWTNYKKNYYAENFSQGTKVDEVVTDYMRGIHWVLHYYFTNDVLSYRWHYEHEYAPFISDIKTIEEKDILPKLKFEKDKPFTPLQQLTLILPGVSARNLLPKSYIAVVEKNKEMYDESKITIDFYRHLGLRAFANLEWTGFIHEPPYVFEWLLKDIEKCELTEDEKKRNRVGSNLRRLKTGGYRLEEFTIPSLLPGMCNPSHFVKGYRNPNEKKVEGDSLGVVPDVKFKFLRPTRGGRYSDKPRGKGGRKRKSK